VSAFMLETDYFAGQPTHTAKDIRPLFGMNKKLFMRILYGVREYVEYFMSKKDCTILVGFTLFHNCMATLRCLLMQVLQIHNMTIYACLNPHALGVCTGFSNSMSECLDKYI
jgi:hypothetical protein